jgi:hypothetical protein
VYPSTSNVQTEPDGWASTIPDYAIQHEPKPVESITYLHLLSHQEKFKAIDFLPGVMQKASSPKDCAHAFTANSVL